MGAAKDLLEEIVPLLSVVWVDEATHQLAITALLAANRRDLSLVDCVSFDVMRRLRIERAFALDQHFADRGFECVP
jgi:predicted nucleic acid-binding protein